MTAYYREEETDEWLYISYEPPKMLGWCNPAFAP